MATKISQLPAASTPLTGTELVPLVQSGKTVQVPVNKILAIDSVSIMSYVPFGTNISTTDCAPYVQLAVNYAIANNLQVNVDGMFLLSSMVNINRLVDALAFDNYFKLFTTNGGGFFVTTNMAMFSSTIPFTTAPVSQLIRFDKITFIGNSGASYVLNDGRFLRMVFDGCDFDKILGCNSSIYTQSIHFVGACNFRHGVGTFWTSTTATFDMQWGGLAEQWTGNFLNLATPVGCRINGLIENFTGTGIVYNGAQGFDICCYFEGNGKDIDGTGSNGTEGVLIHGSHFIHTDPADYSVIWGSSVYACASIGNYHNGSMHNVYAGAGLFVTDYAITSIQNNPTIGTVGGLLMEDQRAASNVPAGGLQIDRGKCVNNGNAGGQVRFSASNNAGGANIYSSRLAAYGGRLHFATDTTGGVTTDALVLYEDQSAVFPGLVTSPGFNGPLTNISSHLTAVTTINDTITYTTGGVTLASQTATATASWRVRAFGTFVATNSATARNAQVASYWGTTALPAIVVAVLASVGQTTEWEVEFILSGSSTTAIWTVGNLKNKINSPAIVGGTTSFMEMDNVTPASTTVTVGAQTIDLRFSMSVAVATDVWNVHGVTIERLT